jgi:hypothetical protein
MTPRNLATALDEMGLAPGWVVADMIRARVATGPADAVDPTLLGERLKNASAGFRNLVVGRIAETLFEKAAEELKGSGFKIIDYHEAGENRDYGIQKNDLELPINVKVASTKFRNALRVVGLEPEDCIPISAYKAIGASERVPDLVYADLVDFDMRERVDAAIDAMGGWVEVGWDLLSWYKGVGARGAQDRYLASLFDAHGPALVALAAPAGEFHLISAQRVLAIMRATPRRVPGLGVPAAGTGSFIAEVNVHVSVARETTPWSAIVDLLQREGIQATLNLIRRTEQRSVPAPRL